MNSVVGKFLSAVFLAGSIGLMVGCDIAEEKKSVFRPAHTTQMDSSRPEERTEPKSDAQKENRKPQAFSKIDRVEI